MNQFSSAGSRSVEIGLARAAFLRCVDGLLSLLGLADNENRDKKPLGDTGMSISNHGETGGTVSAEVYDPANRTLWYTYGWPDGDGNSSNPSFDGANKNTWGAWMPFVIGEMTEEGYYTDWNGNITPMGARYLARVSAIR
jgi:hypothetical protein